jgi:5-bromo-4-chloroindolyl phosphate hydrolysis protein
MKSERLPKKTKDCKQLLEDVKSLMKELDQKLENLIPDSLESY